MADIPAAVARPIARVLPLLEPAHLDRDFDYLVPPEMDALAQPGVRVRVRFSGRLIDGFILDRRETTDHTGKLMRLERVVSGERVLTPEVLRLVTAVAARYAGTRADVLRLAIPPRHAKVEGEAARASRPAESEQLEPAAAPSDPASDSDPVIPSATATVAAVHDPSGDATDPAAERPDDTDADNVEPGTTASTDTPQADSPAPTSIRNVGDGPALAGDSAGHSAEAEGSLRISMAESRISVAGPDESREAGAAGSDVSGVDSPGAGTEGGAVVGVDVSGFVEWGRYRHAASFLEALAVGRGPRAAWQALPGEDWARRLGELAAAVLGGGRRALVIVPDQRDLDRVLAACVALVGDSAVGLSAGLGPAARYRRWLSVLRGSARLVVGTRSSVFAPVQNLGLVAIWDDGDDMYAEPRAPYAHAREVAMLRAHETGCAFVAGGFSRTAEMQAVVESGWAHDLVADRAVIREHMPRISAPGDSDVALERDPVARAVRIPGVAFTAARQALAAGDAVLVQVPRRGYVPALACAKCRAPARCRHCNGPLALPEVASSTGAGRPTPTQPSRPHNARELGVAMSRGASGDVALSPHCRWCGIVAAAFRCPSCASRALRAVVIGASRTAEELGRAFPDVPIRGSGGAAVLDSVPAGPQVVVATIGAEPTVPGGYAVALLLDGWALLGRADLRAAEDALRRWMSAAALVRSTGRVVVMADPQVPTVQALVRWDPVGHAGFELAARTEVRFPPAVRLAALDGTTDSIAELLSEAKLPDGVEVLGPVPLPPGARTPFSAGDGPVEVERMILRADRADAAALSRALTTAQAIRSTHRSDAPLRIQIDPIEIG